MGVPYWEEHGPEAAATLGRWSDERRLLSGEGGAVTTGRDGDTFCLHTADTAVDLLSDDDVDEHDRRRASRLLRFASGEERQTYVQARWGEIVAPAHDPPPSRASPTTVDLRVYAGQSNTDVRFSLRGEDGLARIAYRARSNDSPYVQLETTARPDEVKRFLAELRFLGAPSWRQFEAKAVDGVLWTLTAAGEVSVQAGGANAYPPDGEGTEPTPAFDRLLLAVERLLGREFWPATEHPTGLEAVPDDRDRIEHLILAACRKWSALVDEEGVDPGTLREPEFQRMLFLSLLESTTCKREAPAGLAHWEPGNVDLVLEPGDQPIWLELKWCKRRDAFGNCLWDAAKVAAAVRQGRARYGYLLVGAPVAVWERQLPPEASVTGVSCHQGASLVDDHPSWWG